MVTQRVAGEQQRHRESAERRRGAQQAEAERAGHQYVAGIDRQQRGRAAEQNRKEIERDDAEQVLAAANIGDAGEQRGERQRAALRRRRIDADQGDQQAGKDEEHAAGGIDHGRTGEIEQSADCRADDDGGLVRRDRAGDGALEQRPRHQRRHQRMHRGKLEGARRADHQDDGKDDRRGQPALGAADGQRGDGGSLDELAGANDEPPLIAVGDRAHDEREGDHRNELHQPDQAEIEGAVGQLVDLPANRHHHHLEADGRRYARAPEQHVGPVRHQGLRGDGERCRHRQSAGDLRRKRRGTVRRRRWRSFLVRLSRNTASGLRRQAVEGWVEAAPISSPARAKRL